MSPLRGFEFARLLPSFAPELVLTHTLEAAPFQSGVSVEFFKQTVMLGTGMIVIVFRERLLARHSRHFSASLASGMFAFKGSKLFSGDVLVAIRTPTFMRCAGWCGAHRIAGGAESRSR